jgi:serine/threonine protein phosphatase PrpC
MSGVTEQASWLVTGRTVCGAAHRRRRIENQDAVGWSHAGAGGMAVAAADGHGSPASYRSAEGARIAVKVALGVLEEFAGLRPDYAPQLEAEAAAFIRAELVARWRCAVASHWAAHPAETASLETPWTVYGSTIVSVLATATYLLCAQLGDGYILIVSDAGAVVRPWPKDCRLLGVETTSLAGPGAEAEVRVLLQPVMQATPALLLLSTDGYANSFREESGFLKIGGDLLDMIRERGLAEVERYLESWLNETSELGCGDDITIAIVFRAVEGDASDDG